MIKASLAPNLINMQIAIATAKEQYEKFKDKVKRHDYMMVVNFREPSYRKRLALVSLETGEVESFHHVAHGSGSSDSSNPAYAKHFSNINNSHMSSLGAMVTTDAYRGKYGRSLRIAGLEKNINDQVARRVMVIHPAPYVTDEFIMDNNRAGQTWGCFGVDPAISNALIDKLQGGSFIYSFY